MDIEFFPEFNEKNYSPRDSHDEDKGEMSSEPTKINLDQSFTFRSHHTHHHDLIRRERPIDSSSTTDDIASVAGVHFSPRKRIRTVQLPHSLKIDVVSADKAAESDDDDVMMAQDSWLTHWHTDTLTQ